MTAVDARNKDKTMSFIKEQIKLIVGPKIKYNKHKKVQYKLLSISVGKMKWIELNLSNATLSQI